MVKNPSFEDALFLPNDVSRQGTESDQFTNCLCNRLPPLITGIYPNINRHNKCYGWYNPGYLLNGSTPDYFHQDVDPTNNNGKARWADVPINYSNAIDITATPLVPKYLTNPHHGKAYAGIQNSRYEGDINITAKNPWSEVITQRLNYQDTSNYLKAGNRYVVSFWVAKGSPPEATGHSLKRISAYFTSDSLKSDDEWLVYNLPESEHELYMVEKHSTPGGFLTDSNWTLVSDTLTAQKDLYFINIGSFDVAMNPRTWTNLIPNGLIIPPFATDTQSVYYYIDDVSVYDIGPDPNLCDCSDLDIEIELNYVDNENPGHCCTEIYAKIIGQTDKCKLTHMKWRANIGFADYKITNLTDTLKNRLSDTTFILLDKFCTSSANADSLIMYEFVFKTLGGDYGCYKEIYNKLECEDNPCSWVEGYPDYNDSTKLGVRIEPTSLGQNESGQCCFEIKLLNNTGREIDLDRLELLNSPGAYFTNTNTDYAFTADAIKPNWDISTKNIAPFDTITLGVYCISDSTSSTVSFRLLKKYGNGYSTCYQMKMFPIHLNCNACCPDAVPDFEMIKDSSGCCIKINKLKNVGCGTEQKYYLIDNKIPILQTLPFYVCEDNSDLKIRIDILDADSVVNCSKEYDFTSEFLGCTCCEDISLDILVDNEYDESGCRFVIDKIKKSDVCNFDSSITVQYGRMVSEVYTNEGSFNFTEFSDWEYILDNCEKRTLVFDFYRVDGLVCSKEVDLFCQNCDDLDIQFEISSRDSIYLNGNSIIIAGCCIEIIYGGALSDSCGLLGQLSIFGKNFPEKLDTNLNTILNIGVGNETITICKPLGPIDSPIGGGSPFRFIAAMGIYNSQGNLLCSYDFERNCAIEALPPQSNKENKFTREEQLLISNDNFEIDLNSTENLEYFIFDMSGKLIEKNRYANFNSLQLELNVSNLKSGTYFININTDYGTVVQIFKIVR